MASKEELRELVWQQNMRLPSEGLVSLTWGNASGMSEDGLIAIKPSGVPYLEMTPEDIVVIDLDGKVVEGTLRPSVDTATHLELYRAFPHVRGVVHVHSTYATAFSQARRPLDCLGTTHADHFAGPVPVIRPLTLEEVSEAYEVNTGKLIVERFRGDGIDPVRMPAAFSAGHAPFIWGTSAKNAVDNAVALEKSAEMAVLTVLVAGGAPSILEPHMLEIHTERKHGANAYYGQSGGRTAF